MAVILNTLEEALSFLWEMDGEGLTISNEDQLASTLRADYELFEAADDEDEE